ncbi:hypothetical protein [Pseudalkalibacillus berkeleyi]|uniref:Endolytic transglycosylase MltG n=1 Tax=Pseudalkalibacillus berkeleyi TaxID=1069813 RepID=A0ABS9H1Y7_9BACL|nr:hypothetical protein [Pseudalkalibacillus berkeleyi]MCF6137916.1 hypothetical protein [Pseudalkalibacillus berkeleyi]
MFNSGLRGFGAGLIVAAGVLALVYYQGADDQSNEADAANSKSITYEEVNHFLENEGLVAVGQNELDQLKADQDKQADSKKNDEKTEQPKEEKVIETTVVISKGTSTGQVTDYLESKKIIKNSDDLLSYLRSNNLESKVRFGNYKVNNKMTLAEIAKIITSP